MLHFKVIRDNDGKIEHIETNMTSQSLLNSPQINKGSAFSREERETFNLKGKIPYHIEDLDEQAERTYGQYHNQTSNLSKNIFLMHLYNNNQTLFYKLVGNHLEEMLPIIYTPTIGEAVQKYSHTNRNTRGVFISYPDQDHIEEMLHNRNNTDIDLIIVTDGEGILGIGDQSIGGIDIPIGKLMVYILCAGINPHRVLPVQLDVGTNNKALLADPMYLGWRHERISGDAYDEFIDKFVKAVKKTFPNVYLHWEDFGRENARKNLLRYRDYICSFNDDMQGTGTVALACALAGANAKGEKLTDQKVVFLGAGTAGAGIADQIHAAMVRQGLSKEEAYTHFYMVDRQGLLMQDTDGLTGFQKPYARDPKDIASWGCNGKVELLDVIKHVKPEILVGCSTVHGAFNEEIVRTMVKHTEYPIILPLSNPTSKAEAEPQDLLKWTNGKVLMATGSPFGTIDYQGKKIRVSQSNNALSYPGLGLGVLASRASKVSDGMLWATCQALCHFSPALKDKTAPLLPDFSNILEQSKHIALKVAECAREEGLSDLPKDADLKKAINEKIWETRYYPYYKIDEE